MVRLKARYVGILQEKISISIPYGAIKSLNAKSNFLSYSYISIPYGAIKS